MRAERAAQETSSPKGRAQCTGVRANAPLRRMVLSKSAAEAPSLTSTAEPCKSVRVLLTSVARLCTPGRSSSCTRLLAPVCVRIVIVSRVALPPAVAAAVGGSVTMVRVLLRVVG